MLLLIYMYLFAVIAILLIVLAVVVAVKSYLSRGGKLWGKRVLAIRAKSKAHGIILGKVTKNLLYISPEQSEGHIVVFGPSGTGKTSALLIPTLRSWEGTALVVDISGDIAANVHVANKIVYDPTSEDCTPYDVFASINAVDDDTERQERLEQLAYLLLPDKANDSEAGVFFCKNGRKMITAALICYYGMGWEFIKICEHFLSND